MKKNPDNTKESWWRGEQAAGYDLYVIVNLNVEQILASCWLFSQKIFYNKKK